MPRDLPGFYWDSQRNRYFPIHSKPAAPPKNQQPIQRSSPPPSRNITAPTHARKSQSFWGAVEAGKSRLYEHQRILDRHDVLGLHYARTTSAKEQRVPTFGAIKAFVSTTDDSGQTFRLIGDSGGWLYSSEGSDTEIEQHGDHWIADVNLSSDSEISSISISDSYSLVTSLGPISKMRLQGLGQPNSYILTAQKIHDIRCSHLLGPDDIVVGAKQGVAHINASHSPTSTRFLNAHSDVFSVTRQRDLVYAGVRNGNIHRFDLRVPDNQPTKTNLFSNCNPRSPVLHVQLIDDVQFLASHMNGELLLYDIRYTRQSNPLLRFTGHINSISTNLGITTDPDNEFLFVAGEDCRIRGWSLRTGDRLTPIPKKPPGTSSAKSNSGRSGVANSVGDRTNEVQKPQAERNPFLAMFDSPVRAMQVTGERFGMRLWAGYGKQLWEFNLGCRE